MGQLMETMYTEGEYLANNPTWHAEDSPTKAKWIDRILKRAGKDPRSIAEVGCGAGEILVELQKLRPDATFTGFEISPQAFEICSPKANDGLNFYHEDITQTGKGGFDALLVIDIFEHVPDYMGFITALKDKAEIKIFHIPLDLSVQALMRATPYTFIRKEVGHLHYFFKDTALATLKDCGYEILAWDYTAGTQELPGRALRTRLTNLPRKMLQAVNKDLAVRLLGGYSMMVVAR